MFDLVLMCGVIVAGSGGRPGPWVPPPPEAGTGKPEVTVNFQQLSTFTNGTYAKHVCMRRVLRMYMRLSRRGHRRRGRISLRWPR